MTTQTADLPNLQVNGVAIRDNRWDAAKRIATGKFVNVYLRQRPVQVEQIAQRANTRTN